MTIPTGVNMMLKMLLPNVNPDDLVQMISGIAETGKQLVENQHVLMKQNEEILSLLRPQPETKNDQ